MTYFEDMGTVTLAAAGPQIRAVGWLDSVHGYPQGDVPKAFLKKLARFVREWGESALILGLPIYLGLHTCELCEEAGAGGDFGVPSGELLYVAPILVEHYVTCHRYLPPAQFIAAVLESPTPKSQEYRALVQRFLPLRMSPEDETVIRDHVREWVSRWRGLTNRGSNTE